MACQLADTSSWLLMVEVVVLSEVSRTITRCSMLIVRMFCSSVLHEWYHHATSLSIKVISSGILTGWPKTQAGGLDECTRRQHLRAIMLVSLLLAGEFQTVSKYFQVRKQAKEGMRQVIVRSLTANVTGNSLACHTGALSFLIIWLRTPGYGHITSCCVWLNVEHTVNIETVNFLIRVL